MAVGGAKYMVIIVVLYTGKGFLKNAIKFVNHHVQFYHHDLYVSAPLDGTLVYLPVGAPIIDYESSRVTKSPRRR